jgi:hypothetical protein
MSAVAAYSHTVKIAVTSGRERPMETRDHMNINPTVFSGILAATIAALVSPAGAQTSPPAESSHPAMTVYVQVADARFDSYLFLKRDIAVENKADSSDELFYIPHFNSKEREKELADWRRRFNSIVSAATLSERVQRKMSQIKEEFSRAESAAECWQVDHNRERRITVTIVGSDSEAAIQNEYRAASRDFSAVPNRFTCKYMHKVGLSAPEP